MTFLGYNVRKGENDILRVGIITCWYKDISIADYTSNLSAGLGRRVYVQCITAPCICWRRYIGRKDIFQGNCVHSHFPPHITALENGNAPKPLKPLVFLILLFLQLLRGISYYSKCKDEDIIHYQQSSAYQFGFIPFLSLLAIPSSKIRIVTIHWLQKLGKFKFLYKCYKRADKIIVLSDDMKDNIISIGIPKSKIAVVPHGRSLPQLLNLPRNEITFFGAPVEGKGFFTILESLRILRARGREVRLHVYGIYNEEEKNNAIEKATITCVNDLIVWGGRLSKSDFNRKMQESMFTLAPYSTYVSGSSIVATAMGNATPVIGSKIGSTPEYLGDAGLLIEPNDPVSLSSAIVRMLEDPSLRLRLSEAARKNSQKFSWNKVGHETLEIYRECLKRKLA